MSSKAALLDEMRREWVTFTAYLDSLSEADFTRNTDAAGWTAKDHVAHLGVWEGTMVAHLEGKARHEYAGVDADLWTGGEFDAINAIIQQRHKDVSVTQARAMLNDAHAALLQKVEAMSEADLQRPYSEYYPDATRNGPVVNWIMGNDFEHFTGHRPWIEAIVAGE